MQSRFMPDSFHVDLGWQERALHYGDGLFETLLKYEGELPYWPEHYQRLSSGCERLSISAPPMEWLHQRINESSQDLEHSIIKIIVSRGRGGRGISLPEGSSGSAFVLSYPWQASSHEVRTLLCKKRLPINPDLAGLKHLNRLDYVLAALEVREAGKVEEGLLCDREGYLVEGLVSNVFFVKNNRVFTPTLELAGVDGIMRHKAIRELQQSSLEVETGRFTPRQLLDADECFLSNSVRGIRPIVAINDLDFPVGDVTRSLMPILNIPPITL